VSPEHPATFELAGVGTAQADPATGRLLRVNPKLCEITGYSKEELLGMTFTQITHPEDRQKNFESFQKTVRGETSEYEVEKRCVRKDGQVVWVSVNTTIIRGEAGQPLRTLAVIQDITGRVRAEEKLRESNTLHRSIIEGVNDAIFAKDIRGRYLMINSAWASILGKPKKEILGKVDSEILPPEIARRFMEFDRLVMAAGENRTFEEEVPAAGSMLTFLMTKAPYRDSQGEVAGVIGIAHDITERKRAEAEIEARSRQQAVVAEISMRALADTNLSVLMNEAVSLIARTLDCEYCELLELVADGNELLLVAGVGWKEGLVGNATVGAGLDSQAGYTLLSDEPVIVEDLRKESRFSGSPLLNEHGVVSGMSVLVPGGDGPLGGAGRTHHRTPDLQ
jgi:PAS domain S-box-containing protein